MAKSIEHKVTGEIKRVSNAEAEQLCDQGLRIWKYIGKMEARRRLERLARTIDGGAKTGTHG